MFKRALPGLNAHKHGRVFEAIIAVWRTHWKELTKVLANPRAIKTHFGCKSLDNNLVYHLTCTIYWACSTPAE